MEVFAVRWGRVRWRGQRGLHRGGHGRPGGRGARHGRHECRARLRPRLDQPPRRLARSRAQRPSATTRRRLALVRVGALDSPCSAPRPFSPVSRLLFARLSVVQIRLQRVQSALVLGEQITSLYLPCTFPVPSLYLPCTFPVQGAGRATSRRWLRASPWWSPSLASSQATRRSCGRGASAAGSPVPSAGTLAKKAGSVD